MPGLVELYLSNVTFLPMNFISTVHWQYRYLSALYTPNILYVVLLSMFQERKTLPAI